MESDRDALLSPYLFICLMTVIFMDIHTELDHKITGKSIEICSNLWELLYADDTVLIGTRARELNMLIKAIETESAKYNLRLNYDKCNYIGMYGKADIKFKDGSKMQEVQEVTYLGGKLTNKASRHVEVLSRINKALQACMKLKFFWRKTKCSIRWKMQIYNAIIIAQLTYGLSTVQLTDSLLNRLDERGLRYILGIEHSYYSGISNEEVYERVNIALNEGQDLNIEWSHFMSAHKFADIKTLEKVSDYIMRQQNSLYGHIIRADENDIMRNITITESLEPPKRDVLRSGRP